MEVSVDSDGMQTRHRQEQKDLQARIMQKKKQATKKTRKGVIDECAELERQLMERQAQESRALHGSIAENDNEEAVEALSDVTVSQHNVELEESNHVPQTIEARPTQAALQTLKRPNRQQARKARKVAEQELAMQEAEREAASLPDLREREIESMHEAFASKNLIEHDIRSDGHCLYAAVADQLIDAGLGLRPAIGDLHADVPLPPYLTIRQVAAAYIELHADDFVPFLEVPLYQYLTAIRETGEWGGHLEILALAKAYQITIKVLQAGGQVETVVSDVNDDRASIWLGYYKHRYGLGAHYNSLRQAR